MKAEYRTLARLWPLLRLYPWGLPAIVTLGVAASLAEGFGISLFIPLLQSVLSEGAPVESGNWLVDNLAGLFAGLPEGRRVPVIGGVLFASVLVATGLSYANALLFTWLDAHINHQLRDGIAERLLAISYDAFQRRSAGTLLNTLSTETWRVGEALAVVVNGLITLCTLAVYMVLLVLLSWRLTLIVAAAVAVISLVVRAITRKAEQRGRELNRADRTLATRMLELVDGMKLIRSFDRQSHERARFSAASKAVADAGMRVGIIAETVTPVYQVLAAALLIFILLVALRTPAGLAQALVFVFILSRLQPKVQDLDHARVSLASLTAAVDDVTELLSVQDIPLEATGGNAYQPLKAHITFDRVTFRYDADDPPALQEASFRVPAGKRTALVGLSGAGKTTTVNLLLRLYEPQSGAIFVDDQRLDELDPAAWRRRLAVVSQDPYIFNASVRDNIAYGRLDASDEEIRAAARIADADDFIRALPRGYDTELGDHGTRLSGGQLQRVALARAIVRDPDVLILDEATNALDSITEQAIDRSLRTLSGTRTVLVIAHRLSTLRDADHIVVLDGGRVIEEGSPAELLARDGLFRRLYDLQILQTEAAGPVPSGIDRAP